MFWLTSKKPISIFVKNSIAKITKEKNLEFRNINTKENPADLSSRGIKSTELRNCSLWWNGSKWLEEYSTCWPTWNEQMIDQEAIKQIQSKEAGPKIPYEVTMVTESQEETHTTPPGKVKERFSFLSFLTMFYHKAKKNYNTRVRHISRRNGRSQNEMNKVSVRQALSSSCQWRSYDQETSFQNSTESDTDGIARSFGRLTNADLLRDANTNLYEKRKVCSTVDWGFLTVSCWS